MARAHAPHPHHHSAHRLVRWQRMGLYVVGSMALISGVAWLAIHYSVGAGAGELPHPLEAWCMRLHGLSAFAALVLLGALSAAHIPQGWRLTQRRRWMRQRRLGILLCASAMVLALTGYLLYYFAPESVRPALGWLHAAVGVLMTGLYLVHRRGQRPADGDW
jgi:hypothetical protein